MLQLKDHIIETSCWQEGGPTRITLKNETLTGDISSYKIQNSVSQGNGLFDIFILLALQKSIATQMALQFHCLCKLTKQRI